MPLSDEHLKRFDQWLAAENRRQADRRAALRKPRPDLRILAVGRNSSPFAPKKLTVVLNPDLITQPEPQS